MEVPANSAITSRERHWWQTALLFIGVIDRRAVYQQIWSRSQSHNAAFDVQPSCAARGSRRCVPDEHAHRRAARRVERRRGAPRSRGARDIVGVDSRRARSAKRSTCSGRTVSSSRAATRIARRWTQYLAEVKGDTSELNITLLTTLQCNFACDYCFQGDHGDYNMHADKMSLETAAARRRLVRARARSRRARSDSSSRSSAASRCSTCR